MKREEAIKLVKQGFEELEQALKAGHSDALVRYLEVMSRFHSYSLRNAILICLQKPDASNVAGFRTWKKLGRSVKKGEKGIAIFAPLIFRQIEEPKSSPDADSEERSLGGFKVVHVFDIAQTEGESLPDLDKIKGTAGENLAKIQRVIARNDIALVFESMPTGVKGMSSGGTITVDADLHDAEKFAVAIHELAHEQLHHGERKGKMSKTVRETEAEAIAFIVCRAFGVDSSSRSSDYIQLYNGNSETLTESLSVIQSTAEWMIDAINASELECEHSIVLCDEHWRLNGTWIKDDRVKPARFSCAICRKFYGYEANKLSTSLSAGSRQ